MTHHWDEFSKSLAEDSVPRRQSLRLLGAAIAGAVFSPLGFGSTWGAGPDPCKAFCKCSSKWEQNACLAACRNCNKDPRRLCGSCWSGYACTDLANDVHNCGACWRSCQGGPYATSACVSGSCVYDCFEGAVKCNGVCTSLREDANNCGACGNVCDNSGPFDWNACVGGECVYGCANGGVVCNDVCTPVHSDPSNCGGCGTVCPEGTPYCVNGTCADALCNGADLNWDSSNCGTCGNVCPPQFACAWGVCEGSGYGGDYGYGY